MRLSEVGGESQPLLQPLWCLMSRSSEGQDCPEDHLLTLCSASCPCRDRRCTPEPWNVEGWHIPCCHLTNSLPLATKLHPSCKEQVWTGAASVTFQTQRECGARQHSTSHTVSRDQMSAPHPPPCRCRPRRAAVGGGPRRKLEPHPAACQATGCCSRRCCRRSRPAGADVSRARNGIKGWTWGDALRRTRPRAS